MLLRVVVLHFIIVVDSFRRQQYGIVGSGLLNDHCTFNTDCMSGMYCNVGLCSCLSNFVPIVGYCYKKISPAESGCQYSEQCNAVWPESYCNRRNQCICPMPLIAGKTRDGIVCLFPGGIKEISPLPMCPFPQFDTVDSPFVPTTLPHPTDENSILACNSQSTERHIFAADGSNGCVYRNADGNDVYIDDIYDCVAIGGYVQSIPNIHIAADGICCPSRAYTCIQPKRAAKLWSATTPGIKLRWWFNAITGNCEQFVWSSFDVTVKQSPNNFLTQQQCESYCSDTCKRGSPEYLHKKTSLVIDVTLAPLTRSCTSMSLCGVGYECLAIGTLPMCCPTTANICSFEGGRPSYLRKSTIIYDVGFEVVRRPAVNSTELRYYYDEQQGRCLSFLFRGDFGNYNNFLSASDCELFCANLKCPHGSPLRVGTKNQRCMSDDECPRTHRCDETNKICCPRAESVCLQSVQIGNCDQSIRRYYYNVLEKSCDAFYYSGCQGNNNNFESYQTCQNMCKSVSAEPKCPQGDAYKDERGNYLICSTKHKCPINYECINSGIVTGCCPTKAYTCSQPMHNGIQCGAGPRTRRYYYNTIAFECHTMDYLGCDGNANNFVSREDCETHCAVGGCPNGGVPHRDDYGSTTKCNNYTKLCPNTHECVQVSTRNQLQYQCCPTKTHICSLPPQESNNCSGKFTAIRYYYNSFNRQCSQFTYHGCSGNLNSFNSIEDCYRFCSSSGIDCLTNKMSDYCKCSQVRLIQNDFQTRIWHLHQTCSPGDVAHINENTHMLSECNLALQINSCPSGFACTFDRRSTDGVCCGATNMGVCPETEKAYITNDMTVRECQINQNLTCPTNYLCRFNRQKSRYYCCASISGDLCPIGKVPYRDRYTNAPIRCMLTHDNVCPQDYKCQSTISDAFQGYCCSKKSDTNSSIQRYDYWFHHTPH